MEEKNYIRDYYKNKDSINLLETLNNIEELDNNNELKELKRQIKELQEKIENKSLELNKKKDSMYATMYTPFEHKIVLEYNGRNNHTQFNLASGVVDYDTDEDTTKYMLDKKVGKVCCMVGYNLELGLIVYKEYDYKINSDYTFIELKPTRNISVSFMENKTYVTDLKTNTTTERDYYDCDLRREMGREFINKFYGVNYEGKTSLYDLRQKNLKCASFEILIKTTPSDLFDRVLEDYNWSNYTQPLPLYKILDIQKDTYEKAAEKGVLNYLYDSIKLIKNPNTSFLNKTEKEWLDIIDEMIAYEDDLKFYNISYGYYYYREGDTLLKTLLEYYCGSDVIRNNYSFNKYCNYVVNETINQGYTSVQSFVQELRDYLAMCASDDIKPTLYSSYLKMTHDITSRNHKIKIEQEGEDMFKNRYKDFKQFNYDKYKVIAPTETKDLQKEGDNLNHCVASYIKRVMEGQCLIYFLRTNEEESLITFEVRDNTIVQVKGKHNRKPNEEEVEALVKFAEDREMATRF